MRLCSDQLGDLTPAVRTALTKEVAMRAEDALLFTVAVRSSGRGGDGLLGEEHD